MLGVAGRSMAGGPCCVLLMGKFSVIAVHDEYKILHVLQCWRWTAVKSLLSHVENGKRNVPQMLMAAFLAVAHLWLFERLGSSVLDLHSRTACGSNELVF
ncbi:hypothetical protein BaRGS_00024515 [Batillaria attramentaria]|uniref:Secreted protein n=1 Tax=Batillaria attramentaria TaxID=370345 RepID=A0ABD0KBB3_9CAEN